MAHDVIATLQTMKIVGCRQRSDAPMPDYFQGKRRVEWVKIEHPFTAISSASEIHANHNEAQNAALRRRCSAYRRRQNLYAKKRSGCQRVLDVQRLMHNWVRPHWGLGKDTTPAMQMGFGSGPLTAMELLNSRGFECMSS